MSLPSDLMGLIKSLQLLDEHVNKLEKRMTAAEDRLGVVEETGTETLNRVIDLEEWQEEMEKDD